MTTETEPWIVSKPIKHGITYLVFATRQLALDYVKQCGSLTQMARYVPDMLSPALANITPATSLQDVSPLTSSQVVPPIKSKALLAAARDPPSYILSTAFPTTPMKESCKVLNEIPIETSPPSKTSKTTEFATIRVDELIFDTTDDRWNMMPDPLKRGTVVCYDVDRALPWDMFVVIEMSTGDTIKAIRPRIRAQLDEGTWRIELGQDKIAEKRATIDRVKCSCPPVSQGGDFKCHCGAYETNRTSYHDTFVPCGLEGSYEVIIVKNINLDQKRYYPWLEWVKLGDVNMLDVEDGPHCCGD